MKRAASLFLAVTALLAGAEHAIEYSGARWRADGKAAPEARATGILLPPATDLSREAPAGELAFRLTSLPVFSGEVADYAVLGVGDASVVFARDGDAGSIIFMAPGHAPQLLAKSVPLLESGRAAAPVVVSLGYSGAGYYATAGHVALSAAAAAPETREIFVSSGERTAWELLEEAVSSSGTATFVRGDGGNSDSRLGIAAEGRRNAASGSVSGLSGTSTSRTGDKRAEKVAETRTLEVFTPPAVRISRGNAARAAIERQANQE